MNCKGCRVCPNGVKTLLKVLHTKSYGLFVHSVSTGLIARSIAIGLGLDRDEVRDIFLGGLLHDVGKLYIADSIILKDSGLSDVEFGIIRGHPAQGASMLRELGMNTHVVPLIMHHHELPDGGGYPSGLKSHEIPFQAKVVGVADKFSALTMQRLYRPAFTAMEAVMEIETVIKGFFDGKDASVVNILENSPISGYVREACQAIRDLDSVLAYLKET